MSYTYFPPRTNFFPPGMPYLAGMGSLGDYAADLAAYKLKLLKYQRAMVDWNALKKKYDAAVIAYANTVSSIDASYASEQSAYQQDKAAWDKEYVTYLFAVKSWRNACDQIKASNAQRALTIAQGYGIAVPLPSWFVKQGYCLSQAQIDSYAKQCVTVKGLGYAGLGSNDPDCGWKRMPLCAFPAKPAIRAEPAPPTAPKYPAKPTLAAQPVAPGAAPTPPAATTPDGGGYTTTKTPGPGKLSPSLVPVPDPATVPEPIADPNANGGMMRNGLILVALGVGGYLVYRTLRKPKAQAA